MPCFYLLQNRHRVSKEELELEGLLMEEAEVTKAREEETRREQEEEKRLKEQSRERMIDDLMFEDGGGAGGEDADAAAIVARHAREAQDRIAEIRRPKFSTGWCPCWCRSSLSL